MAVNGVNRQLSAVSDRFSYMGTGTVTAVDPFGVLVQVGETVLRAAYVQQSEPDIGDLVVLMRQGATWLALGTSSVTGGNLVQNPSFEDVTDETTPVGWTLYQVAGLSTMESVSDPLAVPDGSGGGRVLEVFSPGAASTALVYSQPIGVTPGDQVEISAYVNGNYSGSPAGTNDVSLRGLWFANATDLYPTTAEPDSTVATITNISEEDSMRVIRGTVTVPGLAVFLRVGLRSVMDADTGTTWDFVTARVVA